MTSVVKCVVIFRFHLIRGSYLVPSHLREVEVDEAEGEELQTHGEAVEQPVNDHG